MTRFAPGSAHLLLADNVVHLDPATAVFEAMLEGWRRQQSAQMLCRNTIGRRVRLIRRLMEFTGLFPWQWTAEEGEAFIDHLRSGGTPIAISTARNYEVSIGVFLAFVRDPRYAWGQVCEERFGPVPQLIFHEGNTVRHKLDYEGDPRRRSLTYDEIQALFDAADSRPSKIVGRGVKGGLSAARDAAVLVGRPRSSDSKPDRTLSSGTTMSGSYRSSTCDGGENIAKPPTSI